MIQIVLFFKLILMKERIGLNNMHSAIVIHILVTKITLFAKNDRRTSILSIDVRRSFFLI